MLVCFENLVSPLLPVSKQIVQCESLLMNFSGYACVCVCVCVCVRARACKRTPDWIIIPYILNSYC